MTDGPRRHSRFADAEGFTLIEMFAVLVVVSVISAIGFGSFGALKDIVQGDADMRLVEWQLKLARETAINQRRSVRVQFTNPNVISVIRNNIPNGTTTLSTIYFEHDAQYLQFNGMPDTPDGFGAAGPVDFGQAATVMFTADGMFTDANGTPVNGTVFIGQPGRPRTARAVTVFGATARIRAFRWDGTGWRQ